MEKIKVVVVDDSALIRSLLKAIINRQTDMEVVGAAPDPLIAREMIRSLNPDMITLDVEMPKMDGLEFLEKLMRLRPTPVLMISTLTEKGSDVTLRALELGAIDFISKPKTDIAGGMQDYAEEITAKIRMVAQARVHNLVRPVASKNMDGVLPVLPAIRNRVTSTEKILVFGASTGGTEALKEVLIHMPPDCPGIVIAQHMPEGFTKSFATRLDSLCKVSVKEAEHGDRILPGHAYLAPGHSHLLIARSANYLCELSQTDPVNRHRPSVDVLYRSAANSAGKNAIGVILTGMGKDGAAGMKEMHEAGAHTFAQDEASCVVFGMPKEAIAQGGVDEVVPLKDMAKQILTYLASMGVKTFRI